MVDVDTRYLHAQCKRNIFLPTHIDFMKLVQEDPSTYFTSSEVITDIINVKGRILQICQVDNTFNL